VSTMSTARCCKVAIHGRDAPGCIDLTSFLKACVCMRERAPRRSMTIASTVSASFCWTGPFLERREDIWSIVVPDLPCPTHIHTHTHTLTHTHTHTALDEAKEQSNREKEAEQKKVERRRRREEEREAERKCEEEAAATRRRADAQ
jgi:hypothetical protein